MLPLLNIAWAVFASVVLCRSVYARRRMSSRARIALLLITLLICPIITVANDFAAINRPNDPLISLDAASVSLPVLSVVTILLVSCEFVSCHDAPIVSRLVPRLLDWHSPPAVV